MFADLKQKLSLCGAGSGPLGSSGFLIKLFETLISNPNGLGHSWSMDHNSAMLNYTASTWN